MLKLFALSLLLLAMIASGVLKADEATAGFVTYNLTQTMGN